MPGHCCPENNLCCGSNCCPLGQDCCGSNCCPWGTECCGFACCTCCDPTTGGCCSNCCSDGTCCEHACDACVDNGALSGGTITTSADPACLGETITFTAGGTTDSGGTKWINCAETAIPPGGVTYQWTLSLPAGYPAPLPPTSGTGSSVSVVAEVQGTYTVSFSASPTRTECPPGNISVGSITASAHGCALALSSATAKPCETVNLTLTASCPSDCGQMTLDLAPQYAPPYDALVPPWLEMPSMAPIQCDGNAHDSTISVVIHGDAPPGAVPIEVTGTVSNGTSCMATGTVTVDRTYPEIELQYKTFIKCEVAGPTPPDFTLYDFFRGDNRTFGYGPGFNESRTFQQVGVR